MAKRPKLPLERYKKVAKDLAPISPKIALLAKKNTLSGNDKRAITRAEDKAHQWLAGSQRLIPLTPKQVRQLKDKLVLVPGFNAVVDRNLGKTPRAEVIDGELFIKDNGRSVHIISADSSNKEKFAKIGSSLFKGKRRRNVWVRFANGRSDTAFVDNGALLKFLVKVWEQYSPEWDKAGLSIDQMMIGYEVYEKGKGPAPKPKRVRKKKRKGGKSKLAGRIVKAVKSRFKTAKKPRLARKPARKVVKKPMRKVVKAVKKPVRKVVKKPVRKVAKSGVKKNVKRAKKNRRH